jgi:HPt (histidine-containing phosphotransfer) domain-containing protein
MDDFLVKPFTMTKLRDLLERWSNKTLRALPQPPTSDATDTREVTLDTRAIDAIRALRTPDLIERIVDLYLQRSPQLIASGDKAAGAADLSMLATAAHELKSSSANLGGERLARICKDCENAARKRDIAATHLWRNVHDEHALFCEALRALRPTASASAVQALAAP